MRPTLARLGDELSMEFDHDTKSLGNATNYMLRTENGVVRFSGVGGHRQGRSWSCTRHHDSLTDPNGQSILVLGKSENLWLATACVNTKDEMVQI